MYNTTFFGKVVDFCIWKWYA